MVALIAVLGELALLIIKLFVSGTSKSPGQTRIQKAGKVHSAIKRARTTGDFNELEKLLKDG